MVDMEGQQVRLRIIWVNTVGDLWATGRSHQLLLSEQDDSVLECRNMMKVKWS